MNRVEFVQVLADELCRESFDARAFTPDVDDAYVSVYFRPDPSGGRSKYAEIIQFDEGFILHIIPKDNKISPMISHEVGRWFFEDPLGISSLVSELDAVRDNYLRG